MITQKRSEAYEFMLKQSPICGLFHPNQNQLQIATKLQIATGVELKKQARRIAAGDFLIYLTDCSTM
ncbi:MAG: hypothetical protein WBQ86_24315, partial [Candidatus Binatus sp.]